MAFDAIIVTAAGAALDRPCRATGPEGGTLVAPVAAEFDNLLRLRKLRDGLQQEDLGKVGCALVSGSFHADFPAARPVRHRLGPDKHAPWAADFARVSPKRSSFR
ncbi:MAG: hypothetical protein QM707_12200 [Arenimonas sp.]